MKLEVLISKSSEVIKAGLEPFTGLKVTRAQGSWCKTAYCIILPTSQTPRHSKPKMPKKGRDFSVWMVYCCKERRATCHPHLMKASHTKFSEVTVFISLPCSPLREWNIKGNYNISSPWKLTKLIADQNFNQPQNLGQNNLIMKAHLCNMGTSTCNSSMMQLQKWLL